VIIDQLLKDGAGITAYDPVAMNEGKRILGDKIQFAKDEYEACIDADAMVLVTEWPEFRVPNFKVLERLLKNKIIFDGRNIYDPEEMAELGFTYYGIGRPKVIN
jgi:UDPglucose 6-dehydrogenase